MRRQARRMVTMAAAGLAGGLLVGCGGGPPPGVDGELTAGWGGFAEPVGFVPDAGACHAEPYRPETALAEYQPVDCDAPHLVETVHVGTFTGEAADLEEPPRPGSAHLRSAYGSCEEQAADHLGADFREGRLWLGVATPTGPGWSGGARWFRCDLLEVESVYGEPVERQGRLAGALGESSDLHLGCYTVEMDDDAVAEMAQVACDESHDAEFVGVWRAPDGGYLDPADGDAEATVYEGCRAEVAEYVGVPVDGDLVYRTGTVADWMSEPDWEAGDRAFRCYLWLPERDLTESLKGDGDEALPVQTE